MTFIKKLDWKYFVFFTYCILLGIAVSKHEPWFDEAQAWLLARDSSLTELYTKYLRYEGSPGLWHTLLLIPAKSGLPYSSMNIIAALIAIAGVYVFIFYSPFPPIVKILYPFTYFSFYQYAVVARSYVLLPLLLFLTAIVYRNRMNRPFTYVTLLLLLGNISMHGYIVALGLAFLYFIDILRRWFKSSSRFRIRSFSSLVLFAVVSLLLILELKPPKDIITFAAFNKDLSDFYSKTLYMLSDSWLTTIITQPNPIRAVHLLTYGIFIVTFILSLFWFILRKKLLHFLVPLIGLGVLFTAIYSNLWHQGSLFLLWLFVLWLSYEEKEDHSKLVWITNIAMTAALSVILVFQIYWSYNSFTYDFGHKYSASRDVANYIKARNLQGKKIYMTGFHTISIQPYFDKNIFCNYHDNEKPSFWLWSGANNIYREPYLCLEKYNPDIIVMGVKDYKNKLTPLDSSMLPRIPGYDLVQCFDGCLYWKNSPYETDSFAIYEKSDHRESY